MDEPFVLVVNPRAGAGAAERGLSELRRALDRAGARYDVRETRGPRDATRIVRETIRSGDFCGVAVVGGDGTLSEAVNGFFDEDGELLETDAWIGPLPFGTGGDFRRTLKISKRVGPMVTRMLFSRPRPIDLGRLRFIGNDGAEEVRAFINIASFGLAGIVDRKVNEAPKWMGGTPAFFLGTLRAMIGYQNQRVRITVDDAEPHELDILNLAVANGQYFGGGMHVAPRAEIDDGLFDVVALTATPIESLMGAADLYRGEHLDSDHVWYRRGAKVIAEPVHAAEHVLLDVDGEAPGRLPATFEILPGALSLRG